MNKGLLLAIYYLRLYLKAENVFLFLTSKGNLFESLDPFTLKDDLYKELLHLRCVEYYLLHYVLKQYNIQKRRKNIDRRQVVVI